MLEHPISHYGVEPHPEQVYETFGLYQQRLADLLEQGVFAEDEAVARNYFRTAYRNYTGDTSKHSYIEPKDEMPVVSYVADKIDAEGREGFAAEDISAADALRLYRRAYGRYSRLAIPVGGSCNDDHMARVYFPMRDLYRRAVGAARTIGDVGAVAEWQADWSQFSNNYEEEMLPYDEEVEERHDTYQRFLLDKDDDETWREVTHRAEHEQDRGENPRFALKSTSTEELGDLAGILRAQTRDEQLVTLAREASNGETWVDVLPGMGDVAFARTLQRFLHVVVTPEDIEAGKKNRPAHAVILGGQDTKAIDHMVFSEDRKVRGGYFRSNPIAESVTVIEPSETMREIDERTFASEPNVEVKDGLPTDMPYDNRSQELIVGMRNTEGMDGLTLSDFYLELARVLKHGGVYVEGYRSRTPDENSFGRWKSLLVQMIVDTVENRGAIPDRLAPEKEQAMLAGLGLTEQTFKYDGRAIRTLVKEGAVKELGWYMLEGDGGVDRKFGIETGGKPDAPRWSQKRQTTRNTIVW